MCVSYKVFTKQYIQQYQTPDYHLSGQLTIHGNINLSQITKTQLAALHMACFLLSHIQSLAHSAARDMFLTAHLRFCPLVANPLSQETVNPATKPQQPTSTGLSRALQPLCAASPISFGYLAFKSSLASSTLFSQGILISTK